MPKKRVTRLKEHPRKYISVFEGPAAFILAALPSRRRRLNHLSRHLDFFIHSTVILIIPGLSPLATATITSLSTGRVGAMHAAQCHPPQPLRRLQNTLPPHL
jgi:hypothetical protein